jgi:hypothetical protein
VESPIFDHKLDKNGLLRPQPPSSGLELLLLTSDLASGALGVTQWLVEFCAYPQTVQKHRKLSRHCRPFVGILASPRSYLLSMAS